MSAAPNAIQEPLDVAGGGSCGVDASVGVCSDTLGSADRAAQLAGQPAGPTVDFVDGDAVVVVPIDMIPGVDGFKPTLYFEYDSGRGIDRLEQSLPEDSMGYGWRVGGLSQIRRCVVGQPQSNSINLTNSDSLCLDGMPLAPDSLWNAAETDALQALYRPRLASGAHQLAARLFSGERQISQTELEFRLSDQLVLALDP